jgi:hypothetical protein
MRHITNRINITKPEIINITITIRIDKGSNIKEKET